MTWYVSSGFRAYILFTGFPPTKNQAAREGRWTKADVKYLKIALMFIYLGHVSGQTLSRHHCWIRVTEWVLDYEVWLRRRLGIEKLHRVKSGVRSRSRSRPESWQRVRSRSRSRSRSDCLDSDSGTFCLNLWYNLPTKGRFLMHFFEIICADVVFKVSRHAHIRINRGAGSHDLQRWIYGAKRGHAPQSGRKWHRINIFLDITRKQSNFYL